MVLVKEKRIVLLLSNMAGLHYPTVKSVGSVLRDIGDELEREHLGNQNLELRFQRAWLTNWQRFLNHGWLLCGVAAVAYILHRRRL